MADHSTDGQADALRLLSRAARALSEEGAVSTDGLLPSYRLVAPLGHAGASRDDVDVAFVRAARALGGDALLRAKRVVVDAGAPRSAPVVRAVDKNPNAVALHAPAGDDAAGNAFALALGLSLEAAKLAHGLRPDADALRAAFATPTDAKSALDALAHGGAARDVVVAARAEPRVDPKAVALHMTGDRPAYVVVGAGAWRVHDLLSPFARRLRAELHALGASLGAPRDDEVYAGIDALAAADDAVLDERFAVEKSDGFIPVGAGAIVVKCESIPDDVDRRAREHTLLLKRARAVLVLVEPSSSSLAAALAGVGASCRAIAVVHEATASIAPAFVEEAASGHVAAVDNAFAGAGLLTTLPSLGLMPSSSSSSPSNGYDAACFHLVQAVVRAQSQSTIPATTKIALKCTAAGDAQALSRVCVDVLSRLGPKKGR